MIVEQIKSHSAPERVVKQFLKNLETGEMKPGQKLPTQDQLADLFGVSRSSIREAMNALSEQILTLQGNGDYDGVLVLMEEYGSIRPQLQTDLDRLAEAGIPVDIVYEQGRQILGLE